MCSYKAGNSLRPEELVAELTEELVRQEQMAVVGRLAGGLAHEIRTPLNFLLGGLSLVEAENLSPPAQEVVGIMRHGIFLIQELSDALLKQMRDTKNIEYQEESVPLDVSVNIALSLLVYELKSSNIIRSGPSKCLVLAQPALLNQVFINLVGNAAKLECKKIWVTWRLDEKHVFCTVEDDGKGVPDAILPNLFQPFVSSRKSDGGTGLGLYISKLSVERFGGKLSYRRSEHGGACFEMTLLRGDYER